MSRDLSEGEGPLCAQCGEPAGGPATAEARCVVCGGPPLLAGRYRLDALLGEGGGGVTYRATRLADGLPVCVKEQATARLRSFEDDARFEREAAVLRQLDHPQIPAYLDSFVVGVGKHRARYLVQELVDGRNLRDSLQSHRYTELEALALLDEVLGILTYLQALRPPVVHRDIKPSNIMLRAAGGQLVLVDFGSVKDSVDRSLGGVTIAGTLGYMAPEQLRGVADGRSDLYGAGATVLNLLSRREPADLLDERHHLSWRGRVTLSAPVAELLDELLASEPDERPASAIEARAWVQRIQRELARSPELAALPEPSERGPSRPSALGGRATQRRPEITAEPLGGAPLEAGSGSPEVGPEPPASGDAVWRTPGFFLVAVLLLFLGAATVVALSTEEVPISTHGDSRPSEPAPRPVTCDGPCVPLSEPFKSGLRFGMSVEDARAARPELAETEPRPASAVTASDGLLSGISAGSPLVFGDAGSPGPQLVGKMAVAGYPASCTLSFFGPGEGLSALRCEPSPLDTGAAHARATAKILRALRKRYGPEGELRTDDYSGARVWTWASGGASLTLSSEYRELLGGMISTDLSISQESRAHHAALERLEAAAEADLSKKRAEAKRAEAKRRAEEAARLRALGGDEAL